MKEAYIVTSVRTPGCRRGRGAFAFTRPEDLLKSALNGLMERTPGVEKKDVEDILVGCAFPEAEQGLNIGRIIAQIAEFPDSTCGATVNRFCACLLYTSDAADDLPCVDLGGRRTLKKKKHILLHSP